MQMGWIDDYLTREFLDLSAQLTHNDASCAHFVGSSLTAAVRGRTSLRQPLSVCHANIHSQAQDLSVLSMLTTVDTQLPSALASFPALAMFYKKMNAR